ncbi:MAG: acylphosphatase [Deltaproteobacteria bacterium]|nr:MAG: acylphosphatase [Deltaproteobacteria bacterium]
MEPVRAKVRVFGLVQGVFFRHSTRLEAQRLGIKGWVRNVPDGSVEAVFEGPKDRVEEIIKWCHKGPPGAVVQKVQVEWEPYRGEFEGFEIRY